MATAIIPPTVTVPLLNCVSCNSQGAYLECCVCGSCFCSVDCQRKFWPQHKDVCMPRLILAPMFGRSVNLFQFPPPPIPQKSDVLVTKDPINNAASDLNTKKNVKLPQKEQANCAKVSETSKVEKTPRPPVPKNDAKQKPDLQTVSQQPLPGNGKTLHGVEGVSKSSPKPAESVSERVSKSEPETLKPSATSIALKLSAEKYAIKPEDAAVTSALQQAPFPEPGKTVKIAHVTDDKMYIYETGPGPNGEPNQFLTLIKKCIEHSYEVKSHLTVAPKVDDIVFAPFEGEYYRAVVTSIEGESVDVFYPDFGNTQVVAWKQLKEINDPRIKYAKIMTHPVWIDNISTFTPGIKRFIEALISSAEFVLTTVIEMPKTMIRMVEMRHAQEQYVLSDKLLALRSASSASKKAMAPKSPTKMTKLVVTNPITYKPVTVDELTPTDDIHGRGVEMVILNASSAITNNLLLVVMKSQYAQYEAMTKECQLYGQIDPNPYEPKENEICLINTKGTWHRAIVVGDDNGKNMQFYLVDISELVHVAGAAQVRRYPPGLTRKLYQTECILENCDTLLEAANGKQGNLANLCGKVFKGDLFKTDESSETMHVTIKSFMD
uniref:MYND-type domain-containing protein n=1 Tax=Anopheles farauti TaxID=69004 RepID=A0A182QNM5_9DIPT